MQGEYELYGVYLINIFYFLFFRHCFRYLLLTFVKRDRGSFRVMVVLLAGGGVVPVVGRMVPVMVLVVGLLLLGRVVAPSARGRGEVGGFSVGGAGGILPAVRLMMVGGPGVRFVCCKHE